ncbi:unnamed protein product, partial [Ectocarpus sp. 12 AP-2014]
SNSSSTWRGRQRRSHDKRPPRRKPPIESTEAAAVAASGAEKQHPRRPQRQWFPVKRMPTAVTEGGQDGTPRRESTSGFVKSS